MEKKLTTLLSCLMAAATMATAQLPLGLPVPPAMATTGGDALVEYINQKNPNLIREKGLTPEQAVEAQRARQAFALRAPERSPYQGPGQNQEFWFTQPEGSKLGYVQGLYYTKGGSGDVLLKAEDATHNMSGRFNGALVEGRFHTINGDLSWADYGLVICHDLIYDPANNWQLYTSVDLMDYPYLISQEVAVDPTTHRVYGTFMRDDLEGYDIAWVNYDTKEIHRIGPAQRSYPGLGMNAEGRLFGVDMDGVLYEISLQNGTDTPIGNTGIVVRDEDDRYFIQSAECSVRDNVLFWAAVTPDGNAALYAIDLATAEATKINDLPRYTLAHCLTVPDTMADDAAPAAVANLRAEFDAGATSGQLAFTLPSLTYSGEPLSGTLDYIIRHDGTETTGSATAGSDVSLTLELAQGLHFVEVYAVGSAGRSPQAAIRIFAGQDQVGQVRNPQLTIDGNVATITWEPALGVNGGNIGPQTYALQRVLDGKGRDVLVRDLDATTFTDELPAASYRQVSYAIVARTATDHGDAAYTNSMAAGTPYELPFYDDFDDRDNFLANYTRHDANGDDVCWLTYINTNYSAIVYTYNTGSMWTNVPADDWLFTPAFNLQAGRKYKLTFNEVCSGSDTQCINKIEVKMGRGPHVGAMTQELMPVTTFSNNTEAADVVLEFTVAEDGAYNIGFHAVSDSRRSDFLIDQIQVEACTESGSPAAVTDLAITAGEGGARSATISFKAPTTTLSGTALTSLTTVRVMKNNLVLHTFEAPQPGEELSYTDNKADNGFNTYLVVAANEVSDGPYIMATGYVGIDIPAFDYSSVGIEDLGDRVRVNWNQVGTTGLNGGYVNPTAVGYAVYEVEYDVEDGMMTAGDYVGMVFGTDHLDVPMHTDEGDQRIVSYAIVAGNDVGYDEYHTAATYGMPVGQPYHLPFIQSASNSRLGNRLMWVETENNPSATYKFSADSYDNDNGSFEWAPAERTYTLALNTGKLQLAGTSNPKLMFAHKGEPKSRYQLAVKIQTPDRAETLVDSISYQDIDAAQAEWKLETIDLSDFKDEDYIVVKFKLSTNAITNTQLKNKSLLIDAINVLDMQLYNLSVDLDTPGSIVAGRPADIGVVVHNVGERQASGYNVKLFLDGKEMGSRNVSQTLASLGQHTTTFTFTPSIFDGGTRATLRAELDWLYDLVPEDNEMEAEVAIGEPSVAKPQNAQYTTDGKGVTLTWDAPEQKPETITESFEGPEYTDFDLCGITMEQHEGKMGEWTVWNLDGDGTWNGPHGPTGHLPSFAGTELDGVSFPNMGEVCAWMVFNNAKITGSMPILPVSGQKMAATFDDYVQQDTWLISPELTGNEQTIAFSAAAPIELDRITGEADGVEVLEVLVSEGGLTPADFISLGTDTIDAKGWHDYEIDLDEGTRYFAIRNITSDYGAIALFVDDVTFEHMSSLPTSYNIYADRLLLQNVPAGQSFGVDGKAQQYAVSAVYANGDESLPVIFTAGAGIVELVPADDASRRITIYDLHGRRVAHPAQNGIYIVGGKKVVWNNENH